MDSLPYKLIEARDNLKMAESLLREVTAKGNLDRVPMYEFMGRTNRELISLKISLLQHRIKGLEYLVRRNAVLARWHCRKYDTNREYNMKLARAKWFGAKREERIEFTAMGIDQVHQKATNQLTEA